eukprot:1368062-Pyramimonas_sp.AAC.1
MIRLPVFLFSIHKLPRPSASKTTLQDLISSLTANRDLRSGRSTFRVTERWESSWNHANGMRVPSTSAGVLAALV